MFRLRVAFNAALPDQVWVLANAIAFPTRPLQTLRSLDCVCWGQLDLPEIARQDADPYSPTLVPEVWPIGSWYSRAPRARR